MASLHRDVRRTRKAAHASGTSRNLVTQWKAYFMFCIYFNLRPIPTSVETLCLYVEFLARSLAAYTSIQNYLSGVRTLHLRLGSPFPSIPSERYLLDLGLKGIQRTRIHIPHQAAPVSPSILLGIFNLLDVSKPVDAVFWSLFLFAFFTLARKSNLVADLVTRRGRQVLRKDVSPSADGLLVIFYWTKTLQDRSRALHIPLVSIPGSPLCPVQAYLNMIRLVPAAPSKPAFVLPTSKSVRAVSYADFMLVLRKLVALIGLDPSKFSTHNFRRGGTTYAFQAEVPDTLIKAQGDWSSSAYLSYIDMSVSRRRTVGIKMRDRILSGNWVFYHPAPIRSVPQRPD